jgi:DNA-binding XRE family transcriptional regulator
VGWAVEIGDEFEPEFDTLDEDVQTEILALSRMLEQFGPHLGRPRVDTLKGSRHANMKELRFSAAAGEWRVAFAFDRRRRAILFVAGDKAGEAKGAFIESSSARLTVASTPIWPASKRKEVNMSVNVNDKIRKLSAARRKKVEARAKELIAEEMTLRELRKARKLTQVRMARKLRITQDGISRLEKRSDLLLSTLRKTVEAMGGNLSLIAEFPDRAPVVLSGLAESEAPGKRAGRRRSVA